MRIVKEAEERKNEILDAAEILFAQKGFEGTSTTDILEYVGIARGTLYYHFKSKEEILDGVINRMSGQLLWKASEIVADKSKGVLDRLTEAILALNVNSQLGQEVMEQMHKQQNALMHQKMQDRMIEGIVPILNTLVEEGMEEGIIHTSYGAEALEMIMLYATVMFDNERAQTPEHLQCRMQGFICNAERLLGTEEGKLQQVIMKIFTGNQLM